MKLLLVLSLFLGFSFSAYADEGGECPKNYKEFNGEYRFDSYHRNVELLSCSEGVIKSSFKNKDTGLVGSIEDFLSLKVERFFVDGVPRISKLYPLLEKTYWDEGALIRTTFSVEGGWLTQIRMNPSARSIPIYKKVETLETETDALIITTKLFDKNGDIVLTNREVGKKLNLK